MASGFFLIYRPSVRALITSRYLCSAAVLLGPIRSRLLTGRPPGLCPAPHVHAPSHGPPQSVLPRSPAPKLNIYGKLDPKKATEAELRGQELFFNKGQCAACHVPPYYTDNLMHNLRAERFFKPQMVNGRMAPQDGPIKTFPLRGIKDSAPYLHDGPLLTLEDMV